MTTWLISSNDAYFKLNELFKERPTIDWKQDNHKYAVGDIILFYSAKPDGRIMYEGEVIKTNLVESETDDDSEFIIDRAKYIKNNKYWMRISMYRLAETEAIEGSKGDRLLANSSELTNSRQSRISGKNVYDAVVLPAPLQPDRIKSLGIIYCGLLRIRTGRSLQAGDLRAIFYGSERLSLLQS